MDEKIEEVINDLVDKANWAADKLEDAASGVIAGLGHLVPGESEAEKAIKKWNDELQPAIQEGIYKVWDEVSSAVSDLAGDPLDLISYSAKMIAAKETLYQQNTLDQDITNLGNTWTGTAYESYKTVASEQSAALLALANTLQAGGQLTRDGADRILSLWLELIQEFVSYSASAISVIGSCADVGKALGAWISTIADAIALIWQTVGDLGVTLGKFFKDQILQASAGWEMISAGSDGLANNQWPMIAETTSDTMNHPGSWPAAV
jgi:uncharacterized protein YukE